MTEYASSPIAIIGNGFAALAVAQQLVKRGVSVRIIGPATRFGRGTAYGAARPEHLLNVPAERMGWDADAPGDFADWLGLEGDARRAFLPRSRYGDYLLSRWDALMDAHGDRIEVVAQTVPGLQPDDAGWRITLADGATLTTRDVVLAIGNADAPDAPDAPDAANIVTQPWAAGALERIPADAPVLVLGSGLTMIDIASTLLLRGHHGGIHALSRRGLTPDLHPEPPLPPHAPSHELLHAFATQRLSRAVRLLRQASEQGIAPAALADGLRPHVATIWRGMKPATRSRFLRHLRPWWDRMRHRVPGEVMQRLRDAEREGRFSLRAGRLIAHRDGVAEIQPRGTRERMRLPATWLVYATGWDGDAARLAAHPVLRTLIAEGLAMPDPLGLGLACDAHGQLLGRDGPTSRLHLIGNLRRGECWESSAVPELRAQAAALAERLAPA